MEVQHWAKKPEEHASQQEIDSHIKTKQWEADAWRQADTAATIELAELYNRRQVTYNGNGAKSAADNKHAKKPHSVSKTGYERCSYDASAFKQEDVAVFVSTAPNAG